MTLMPGCATANELAGMVGLSGYLPLAAQTAAERSDANHATADLPGARPLRRRHRVLAARWRLARRCGARLPGRVARVPDGAFGLHGGDRRPGALAETGSRLSDCGRRRATEQPRLTQIAGRNSGYRQLQRGRLSAAGLTQRATFGAGHVTSQCLPRELVLQEVVPLAWPPSLLLLVVALVTTLPSPLPLVLLLLLVWLLILVLLLLLTLLLTVMLLELDAAPAPFMPKQSSRASVNGNLMMRLRESSGPDLVEVLFGRKGLPRLRHRTRATGCEKRGRSPFLSLAAPGALAPLLLPCLLVLLVLLVLVLALPLP